MRKYLPLTDHSQHSADPERAALYLRADASADTLYDAAESRQAAARDLLRAIGLSDITETPEMPCQPWPVPRCCWYPTRNRCTTPPTWPPPAKGSAAMTEHRTIERIRQIAAAALQAAPLLVPELLPHGARKGSEWWSCNPTRGDREIGSFSVSLTEGRWHDFASGDGGGDLVSLAAYLWGVRQADAAHELARLLGLDDSEADERTRAAQDKLLQRARQDLEQRRQDAEAAKLARQQTARQKAARLWIASSRPDPLHPYLIRKRVPPHGLRQHGGELLVCLRNLAGDILNLQRIDADGNKRFLPGGQVTGTFVLIGRVKPQGRLFVCEGWATGAAIHEYTGDPVACAMNAGNLKPVALALRAHYGNRIDLVLAGDDDRETEGNPGRTAANEAAIAACARVCFPDWPADAPRHLSDFNDLWGWELDHGQETE